MSLTNRPENLGGGAVSGIGRSAPRIKINTNPNTTPARTGTNVTGRSAKYDYNTNVWNSREGTDNYGNPTYNAKAPIKPLKINTNPVTNFQPRIGGHAN